MANINPLNHPICLAYPLRLAQTAWAAHVPFGMFLVDVLRPRVIVELGTYTGVSYCAFCQAVKELKLDARCYAIDTWQGDGQTGFYEADILADLRAHHDPHYESFSCLLQSTFDDALPRFADGEIDLLHIDGCHSYDAVRHDFESWLPKMSSEGVVLLHDTNVRERGFGVWRFWEELKSRYPHFEFFRGYGLGVAATGQVQKEEFRQLLESSEAEAATLRDFFHQSGQRLTTRLTLSAQVETLSAQVRDAKLMTETLSGQLEAERHASRALSAQLEARETYLENILNSRAWRWVNRYGRAKNRCLAPIQKLLQRPPSRGKGDASEETSATAASNARVHGDASYQLRVSEEIANFKEVESVHDLPAIFHYWSNKYLRPKFELLGFSDPNDFFIHYVEEAAGRDTGATCRVLSVGAGNCDAEVVLADLLIKRGVQNFVFHCLDLNPHMLERGKRMAAERRLSHHFEFVLADIKGWERERTYQVVIANQSLHHFLELETLFEKIYDSLDDEGFFLTNDMIGRNGHMLWPEAEEVVSGLWSALEPRHRWNHQLKRREEIYENHDCSTSGFEGIRAQDILPLLIGKFKFHTFLGFANLITVFTGRGFGPNFDAENSFDRTFIDFVAALDEHYIEGGRLKPTQMIAAMTKREVAPPRVYKHLTPEFCVRRSE